MKRESPCAWKITFILMVALASLMLFAPLIEALLVLLDSVASIFVLL